MTGDCAKRCGATKTLGTPQLWLGIVESDPTGVSPRGMFPGGHDCSRQPNVRGAWRIDAGASELSRSDTSKSNLASRPQGNVWVAVVQPPSR